MTFIATSTPESAPTTAPAFDPTALIASVQCRVVLRADADYDEVRRGFNGMIDRRPFAILFPETDADVAAGIRFARANELPLAIRAGGHSAPGFGHVDDGLVIDCRALMSVDIDPDARTIRCGTGLTWADFDAATGVHGLAVTGGRVSGTGVAGLTIGSGSGWLERAMGLTSDSLIGARLVAADGDTVDTDDDPELLWALRGGGGNFGVITELRFQLHPLGPVVHGGIRMYDGARGDEVLRAFRDVMMVAPKELCAGLAFIHAPHAPFVPERFRGTMVAATIVLWVGDAADGPAGLAPLDALGTPIVDTVGSTTYPAIQHYMDAGAPSGWRDYFKGGFMTELSDAAIDTIVALANDMDEELTQIICAPLGAHTAYAIPTEEHSAIGHRNENWSFQVLSLWHSAEDDVAQKAWTQDAARRMSSYSDMVSYPNFLSADDTGDVSDAYSPSIMRRLREVKRRYDPQNVFRRNNNILPAT